MEYFMTKNINHETIKSELIKKISIVLIGILFIPLLMILILLYQRIQYNSQFKTNLGENTELIAQELVETTLNELNDRITLLAYWPQDNIHSDKLIELENTDLLFSNINSAEVQQIVENTIGVTESSRYNPESNIQFTGDHHLVLTTQDEYSKYRLAIFDSNLWSSLFGNPQDYAICILNNDHELAYLSAPDKTKKDILSIINGNQFTTLFKEEMINQTGYLYYNDYGLYGRQIIIGHAPMTEQNETIPFGSIIIIRETSMLLPNENSSKIALFIATFIGGSILIKLMLKFSEMIILQFLKLTGKYEKIYQEKQSISEKLIISEKLASLGRVTSGIAHEIGNPLSSIITISQILSDASVPINKRLEFASKIHNDAMRIDHIIKDFLAFGRGQLGTCENINVNNMIEEAILLLPPQRLNPKVKLIKDYSDHLPHSWGDQDKLQIAIMNIILNAYQAQEKEGLIYIHTTSLKDTISIRIKDMGEGIPADIIDKIFDPFYTSKDVGDGTGLGLFICQQIIEAHNGTIEVVTDHVQGTEFILHLPIGDHIRSKLNE